MKALLIDTLETLGYPVYLQGTIGEDEPFPPSFITFFTLDSPDNAHFDNAPVSWAWRYQVTFYSSDPALIALNRIKSGKRCGLLALSRTGEAATFLATNLRILDGRKNIT